MLLSRFIRGYCRLLGWLMVTSLALMVAMVFSNVVMRYALNSGITLSEELSRWLFVWMTFMGAVVALHERAHMGTDALVARLPRAGQKLCLGISLLVMCFLCWLMFDGAWQQVKINWDSTSAVMETSMGWFYASGMVFAVLAAPVLLLGLFRLLSGQMSERELLGLREAQDGQADGPIAQEAAK